MARRNHVRKGRAAKVRRQEGAQARMKKEKKD